MSYDFKRCINYNENLKLNEDQLKVFLDNLLDNLAKNNFSGYVKLSLNNNSSSSNVFAYPAHKAIIKELFDSEFNSVNIKCHIKNITTYIIINRLEKIISSICESKKSFEYIDTFVTKLIASSLPIQIKELILIGNYYVDCNNNMWHKKKFSKNNIINNTLENCSSCVNCINCKNCVDCVNCKNLENCTNSINCNNCIDCKNCKSCDNCRTCIDCSRCKNCNECEDSIKCKNSDRLYSCIECKYCVDCDWCTNCKYCTECSKCKLCKNSIKCKNCFNCKNCLECINLSNDNNKQTIIKQFNSDFISCPIIPKNDSTLCLEPKLIKTKETKFTQYAVMEYKSNLVKDDKSIIDFIFNVSNINKLNPFDINLTNQESNNGYSKSKRMFIPIGKKDLKDEFLNIDPDYICISIMYKDVMASIGVQRDNDYALNLSIDIEGFDFINEIEQILEKIL